MKNKFIRFDQAVELKKLGFNEPCLAYYTIHPHFIFEQVENASREEEKLFAPLFQDAFEWFRKFKLSVNIHDLRDDFEVEIIEWTLGDDRLIHFLDQPYLTYREAEEAAVNKLIEIRNGKNKN